MSLSINRVNKQVSVNSNKCLVSILVAYYDNVDHIEEAIVSAVSQTYVNLEIIVVDDCSPSVEAQVLIKGLAEKYGFKLIRNDQNLGAAKSFQVGFNESSGKYISILSHDDVYSLDKIDKCMDVLLKEDLDAVYGNGASFSCELKGAVPFDSDEVMSALGVSQSAVAELISGKDEIGSLLTQGAIFSRKIWSELEWVRSKFLLDDWPFTILVWRNYKVSFLNEVMYFYRLHDFNVHKNYWKWFPARVQTIAELIEPESRMDVLSFMLSSMSTASRKDGAVQDALRFALCAALMAGSSENYKSAMRAVVKANDENSLNVSRSTQKRMKRVAVVFSSWYRIKKILVKVFAAFIPGKARRKAFRDKFLFR